MYIFLAIVGGWLVFLIGVARWEKRMVWAYGAPEPYPQFADDTGYGSRQLSHASTAGFSCFGWSPDLKGPRYRVSYGLLVSPERDCLVIIGIGTIFGIPLRGTWIYSQTTDGRVFYTTDNMSSVDIDVSRRWRNQLVEGVPFAELLQHHRNMLRDQGVTAQPFIPGRELEEFCGLREARFRAMADKGLIYFTDVAASHWRYTIWGAVKWAVLNQSIGLLRGFTKGRVPRIA